MNIKQKAARMLFAAMLACTLLAGIAILLAALTQYDNGSAYFMEDAWLPGVALSLALIGCIAGTVGAILTPAQALSSSPFCTNLPSPVALSGLVAAGIMAWGYTQSGTWINLIAALLLLLTALYAGLSSLSRIREQYATALVYLGFFAVFCCMLIAAICYFDMSVEMNAPAKVSTQIALLITAVYFTTEMRVLLGIPLPRLLLSLLSWLAPIASLSVFAVFPLLYLGEILNPTYLAASALLVGVLVSVPLRMHAQLKPHTVSLCTESNHAADAENPTDTPTDDANGEDLT